MSSTSSCTSTSLPWGRDPGAWADSVYEQIALADQTPMGIFRRESQTQAPDITKFLNGLNEEETRELGGRPATCGDAFARIDSLASCSIKDKALALADRHFKQGMTTYNTFAEAEREQDALCTALRGFGEREWRKIDLKTVVESSLLSRASQELLIEELQLASDGIVSAARVGEVSRRIFCSGKAVVHRSAAGNEGAILVSRLTPELKYDHSVIKKTNVLEAAGNEVARILGQDWVLTAHSTFIDFSDREHSERLQASFSNLFTTITKSSLEGNVMLSERVMGKNLWESARKNEGWGTLSQEHKNRIYRRIGELAVMDLIMGYQDRFFSYDSFKNPPGFDSLVGANMGNTMVYRSCNKQGVEKAPQIYAIDNSVSPYTLEGGEDYESYNVFFENMLSQNSLASDLFNQITSALHETMSKTTCAFYEESNLSQLEKEELAENFNQGLLGDLEKEKREKEELAENFNQGLLEGLIVKGECEKNLTLGINRALRRFRNPETLREILEQLAEVQSQYSYDEDCNRLFAAVEERLKIIAKPRGDES